MFSILRYPLFLSLVVDFAVAFNLSWPGSSVFYVDNETATLMWNRERFDPPNIVLYVTQGGNVNRGRPYTPGPEQFGKLPIDIPQSFGNFAVSAYTDDEDPSQADFQLATAPFTVLPSPNGTISTDTSSPSQTFEPTSSSSNNSTPNTPAVGSTIPPSAGAPSTPTAQAANLSTGSNKSIIIGSVVGGVMFLILASLLILIAIRRCRTRRDTVQFYENKMVRPSAAAVRDPTWEPLRLDSDPDSKHDDPLPEYGYSNYDVIEKADYRPISPSISPLPSGAMSLRPKLPKIIMTPATPSQRDSSVLTSVRPLSLISEWEPEPLRAGAAGPSSLPLPPPPQAIPSGNPELEHLQVEINELRREMDESENIGDPAKRRQMMMEIANKLTLLERLVQGR